MVIMSVSRSRENAMLNTVRMLRRLLRNAFFVTNRVNVISELQEKPGTGTRRLARPDPARINEPLADYNRTGPCRLYLYPPKITTPKLRRSPSGLSYSSLLHQLASGDRHQPCMTNVTKRSQQYHAKWKDKVTASSNFT